MGRALRTKLVPMAVALAAIVGCALSAFAQSGRNQLDAEWDKVRRELEQSFRSNPESCRKAWDVSWHWAKRGVPGAQSDLGIAIALQYLIPPGLSQDVATRKWHAWTLTWHGLVDEDSRALPVVQSMVRSLGLSQGGSRPFDDCLAASDRRACIKDLVNTGLLSDFDAYVRAVDLLAGAPGAMPVACPAPHGYPK
jgi:hypothetical protein